MKINKYVAAFASACAMQMLSFIAFAQDIAYKGFPQWSWHKEDSTEYYLYTPLQMEPGKKYPVALFMHGCCGQSYHATLRNTVDPPVRMWHNFGANTQAIPTYIIAPATSRGWQQHFANLKKVIDELIAHRNADPQRIYVCGFSMGGEGTFRIIQQYPGYFAAAIPMGMSFRGDSLKVKDIPIWANQGETDWYARNLRRQVAAIRKLNGYAADTGSTWVTGVNPRYSNFKGVGHGVQWNAASTQDLTGWAYSKINDGNKYPQVYFVQPMYKQTVEDKQKVQVEISAKDADGRIAKVELYHNKNHIASLTEEPFITTITAVKGDNTIEAIAWDDKGKSSSAISIIKVNIKPEVVTKKLPSAVAGSYYEQKITAVGNGDVLFFAASPQMAPAGLRLYPDGTFKGIPVSKWMYKVDVYVTDEDGEAVTRSFTLRVTEKNKEEVIITDIATRGVAYFTSKMRKGESPFFNSKDSVLATDVEEINFSDVGKYEGLTYIKTDINDADKSGNDFLAFKVDENVVVYVAYETLDNLKHSTVPAWLQDYKKEEGQIIAQYRYFNVYSKSFPKGIVSLPAADAKSNGVGSNYFVMVKREY